MAAVSEDWSSDEAYAERAVVAEAQLAATPGATPENPTDEWERARWAQLLYGRSYFVVAADAEEPPSPTST